MAEIVDLKVKLITTEVDDLIDLIRQLVAMRDKLEALEILVDGAPGATELSLREKVDLLWERRELDFERPEG